MTMKSPEDYSSEIHKGLTRNENFKINLTLKVHIGITDNNLLYILICVAQKHQLR